MTNVLVLGGTCWLGGEIAKAAAARGHDVTCLARGESGEAPAGVTFVKSDRDGADPYAEVMDTRWDHVFDVSWQPRFVRGAVDALGPVSSAWTYVSSISVYADHRAYGGDEDDPIRDPLRADVADWSVYGEAKARCEQIVGELPKVLIARLGLLAGPGDRSDRVGYWVSRFGLAGAGPVLVPDALEQPVQVIDARDTAAWLVESAAAGRTGIFDVAGPRQTLGEIIDVSADVADHDGQKVFADPRWLAEQDVSPWAGPRSLPLWIPDHDGMGSRKAERLAATGIHRRPLADLLRDSLEFERRKGLDRERKAGLNRDDELALIEACSAEVQS